MADTDRLHSGLSRRGFLTTAALGAAASWAIATPSVGRAGMPSGAVTGQTLMPSSPVSGAASELVDPGQFVSTEQIRQWQIIANDVGLRATGSRSHHDYIDGLKSRMEQVGIQHITSEDVTFEMWEPTRWHLDVRGGPDSGPCPVAWYVPYSGATAPEGITAQLSTAPAAGTIGLITVRAPALPFGLFDIVDYDTPFFPHHPPGYQPLNTYDRPWLGQGAVVEAMESHLAAGAVGLIVIWDLPPEAAAGQYAPYDGKVRGIPTLSVDRDTGARLLRVAEGRHEVTLVLEASTRQATSPNVYGVIPGRSDELVMVQSHTDGTNGLEENGTEGMLAMAQYLARVPRDELPRSVLFVMSTGHMAGHAMGMDAFLTRHANDLVARTAAAVSVEHLGALDWSPDAAGVWTIKGPETNIVFSSPHAEMVRIGRSLQDEMGIGSNRVMRPYSTDTSGLSPNGRWWPGDGEGLWRVAGLPSLQSIAGPTYLLNANFDCSKFIDLELMRRQCIAFTNSVLRMTRTPWHDLRLDRHEDPFWGPPLELINEHVL